MPNTPAPQGVIGPHEGRELALMLSGSKHVALFDSLPADFAPYLQQGKFHALEVPFPKFGFTGMIIFCPKSRQQAERLKSLLLDSVGRGFVVETEREIGRILGYTEADIETYLRHITRKR
ncbi:hypothetical protein [Neisseria perflava]|uniref:hypothetical protein n=1 Tax=Neisseria perflava TaxID=33053 RepID=UPI00209F85ED|nr:hypothetical protein [Neisseria perflava]MCP1660646.1 hypothetical protein [Neisseria perflava]MCP1771906.1 hypothetical protein [Neisseria perflava]